MTSGSHFTHFHFNFEFNDFSQFKKNFPKNHEKFRFKEI